MDKADADMVKTLLKWRDAALRTCGHLGMTIDEFGAYLALCQEVGHVPEIGGVKRPDLLRESCRTK